MPEEKSNTFGFKIKVLGRMIELLGVQMYKRREAAIAELVANSWDAGATVVRINLPDPKSYSPEASKIEILDNGSGMDKDDIQESYLVLGRNRRAEDSEEGARPIMGRKGIGKLAGFGIATKMEITTWNEKGCIKFGMDSERLKVDDQNATDIEIPGQASVKPSEEFETGTLVSLGGLKHVTGIDPSNLRESLARVFSPAVLEKMEVLVNGVPVTEPEYEYMFRHPVMSMEEITLDDGHKIRYWYGFSSEVIKNAERRGFVVRVHKKSAQASPFFFNVEATASGQHATKYLTGAIEADYLDDGKDTNSDIVSTDRQEIDWNTPIARSLYEWGQKLTRKALVDCASKRGEKLTNKLLSDLELAGRIDALDKQSQAQVKRMLGILASAEADEEKASNLADGLVMAYEYRHFHDLIGELEGLENDPDGLKKLLERLKDWKVLESRAILEIIKGRIGIMEKFHSMIVNDAPETAPEIGADNMHDLIAGYPWLLDPEWQVLSEEKSITKQLREWGLEADPEYKGRYDFLALQDDKQLVLVEIKRAGHAVELAEMQRLDDYKNRLAKAHQGKDLIAVLVYGGQLDINDQGIKNSYASRSDFLLLNWSEVYQRTQRHYEHYRAVLEGDVENPRFHLKSQEVQQTRKIIDGGSTYRGKQSRLGGLGGQDVDYLENPQEEKPQSS